MSTEARSEGLKKKPLPSPTKRIKKRSEKTQKFYGEERIPFVIDFLARYPKCQVQWDGGCQVASVDVHEVSLRSRGGNLVPIDGDESNFLAVCRYCHRMIDMNKAEATAKGFIK